METVAEQGGLVLRRREDGSLELRANGVFVMDTAETSTERALGECALRAHGHPRQALVGGLGLGFTLQAVLEDPRVERCTVVEVEPALVHWMSDGTVPHGPALLADPRADIQVADVAVALRETPPAAYDVVLLDVDNGPGYLVHDANAALYEPSALSAARAALRADGVLVVWSAAEAPGLATDLEAVFGNVEPVAYPVRLQGRAESYWLYVARR